MKYGFEMPSLPGIKDRLSTMTSAFANSIIPAIQPTEEEVGIGAEETLERSPFAHRRASDRPRLLLRPETLQCRMAQPILQPLPVLDLDDHAGLHPLWGCVGHFVEIIMQDWRRGEWARFAMRGFQFLEDDHASVRGEAKVPHMPA
jgi:hypothetical protein